MFGLARISLAIGPCLYVPQMVHCNYVSEKPKSSTDSPNQGKRIPAIFYRTEAGGEPVREWLKGLSPEDRKRIGGHQDGGIRMAGRHARLQTARQWHL